MPAQVEAANGGLERFRLPDRTELIAIPGRALLLQNSEDDLGRHGPEWSAPDLEHYDDSYTSGFVVSAAVTRSGLEINLHHYGPNSKGGVPAIDERALHDNNYVRDTSGLRYEVPIFRGSAHTYMHTPTRWHVAGQIVCMLPGYRCVRNTEEGNRLVQGQDISMLVRDARYRSWPITVQEGAMELGTPKENVWLTRICTDAEKAARLVNSIGRMAGLDGSDKALLVDTASDQLASLLTEHQIRLNEQEARRIAEMTPLARRLGQLVSIFR